MKCERVPEVMSGKWRSQTEVQSLLVKGGWKDQNKKDVTGYVVEDRNTRVNSEQKSAKI